MKITKVRFIIIAAILVAACVFTARAVQNRYFASRKTKNAIADTAYHPPVYDRAALAAFEHICHHYDTIRQNYTISGRVSLCDPADTSANLKDVPFLCCKKGGELYYKLGNTETINAAGSFLYIDHQGKTIMLSAQKDLQGDAGMKVLTGMNKNLLSEDYKLKTVQSGGQKTYTLVNEHHISVKEYSLTVDALSGQLRRITTRLSGSTDPLRKDNEKLIDIRFNRWDAAAEMNKYKRPGDVVRTGAGEWTLSKGYSGYQLIRM